MNDTVKYVLDESRIPKRWYNIMADLPKPPPAVLHPGTKQPVGPDDLAPLFPMALIQQEVTQEREIDIPEPVREIYRQWPSNETQAGRSILAKDKDHPGSLGIAISEAVEVAATRDDTKYALGSTFTPPGFHAGGLRYHGMAPLVSHCLELGLIEARAYKQVEVFSAGVQFARAEGILPAPEANHAVKGAIDEALRCRTESKARTILFNLCGHGHFDMQAYMDYFAGKLQDQHYDEAELAMALAGLPSIAA